MSIRKSYKKNKRTTKFKKNKELNLYTIKKDILDLEL
jgi:hypothetical protein